jgi:hypothetical protein
MKLKIGLVGVLVVAGACTSAEPPEETAPQIEGVLAPLADTVDRARGVQETIDEQAAELKRRIEEQER